MRLVLPLVILLAAAPALAQQPPDTSADPPPARDAGPLTYTQPLAPDAIRAIQGKLRDAGAFSGAVDGNWGADGAQALETFQQTRGLQVTGQINQATAAVLGLAAADLVAAGGTTAPAPAPAPQAANAPSAPPVADAPRGPVPLGGDAVRAVQARMRDAGYYAGPIDGAWGAGSQQALLRLQQARGLPVTGRIDSASVRALGFDPNAFP